jgi:hypothetical protein
MLEYNYNIIEVQWEIIKDRNSQRLSLVTLKENGEIYSNTELFLEWSFIKAKKQWKG